MLALLEKYKPRIDERVAELGTMLAMHGLAWAEDASTRLPAFIKKGKGVRSALLLGTIEALSGNDVSDDDISLAAALEYLHSALLIHDDLIDHDELRRGEPSAHKQYEAIAKQQGYASPRAYGESIALCLGDVAIFSAYLFLSRLSYDPSTKDELAQTISREFLTVGYGEMDDIDLTYANTMPNIHRVMTMYRYKTARYTFSLPLLLACIVTHQDKAVRHTLESLGEDLGVIFQLTDDMLTLVGNQDVVGKTVGNDIEENKKTLYAVLLHERANDADKKTLRAIFGKKSLARQDLKAIIELVDRYDIRESLQEIINDIVKTARSKIAMTPFPTFFEEMLAFLLSREK